MDLIIDRVSYICMHWKHATEEYVGKFHPDMWNAFKKLPGEDLILIIGDFNSKVGFTAEVNDTRNTVGKYELSNKNQKTKRLIYFWTRNNLFIANTGFQIGFRHLYTWRSPRPIYRNEIDWKFFLPKASWRMAHRWNLKKNITKKEVKSNVLTNNSSVQESGKLH